MLNRIMTYNESAVALMIFSGGLFLSSALALIFDKKLSNKTKIKLIKISVGVGSIIVLLGILLNMYASYKYNIDFNKGFYGFITFTIGIAIASPGLMISTFCHFPTKKPIRYPIKQSTYEEFSAYLKTRVLNYHYELYDENETAKFYQQKSKRNINYIIDVKVDELSEESFEDLYNNKIFPVIEEDFETKKNKSGLLNITMLLSVNKITPMFYKFIDSKNQDHNFFKFPVGISFGSNQIYLTGNANYGFHPCQHQIKEIKEILELNNQK